MVYLRAVLRTWLAWLSACEPATPAQPGVKRERGTYLRTENLFCVGPGWRTCDDSWPETRRVESRRKQWRESGVNRFDWLDAIRTELAVSRSAVVPWKASNSQRTCTLQQPGRCAGAARNSRRFPPCPSYSFFFSILGRACTAARRPTPWAISLSLSSATDYSVQSTPYIPTWTLACLPSALDLFSLESSLLPRAWVAPSLSTFLLSRC